MTRKAHFASEFAVSGASVGVATACTNPIDVVKVRLQLQRLRLPGGIKPDGMVMTAVNIVRQEGVLVLWSGWQASVARSFLYGGARLGLYQPIRKLLGGDASPSFGLNLVAGSFSGGLAAVVCNPTELVKVRLQSKESQRRGPVAVIRGVVSEHGIRGLWRGTVPSATRAAVLTATQCATYNEIKSLCTQLTGWEEGVKLHFAASTAAGLVSTTATSPVDVIKTHMYVGGNKYTGPVHCLLELLKQEGVRGLFKGWGANLARLGPQTTITFVCVEKFRQLAGLQAL